MALLDAEGTQLVIEMVIASAAGIIGLWFLKKRTKDRAAAKESTDKQQPPPS
ncbi:hypothetical protein [Nitrososphaera viennensis]|nr:hypothetical protein [Nitrososphaera viennensis]UVS68760.1 hypothetical protein NWT39_12745 [Nitrososphaera viennensis]